MKRLATLLMLTFIAATSWTARADDQSQQMNKTHGNLYLGISGTSLALDQDRVPGVPSTSPGHTSKIGSLVLGYQFDDLWSADVSFGTNMSDNIDVDVFTVNGYRYFGSGNWRPYVSAGASSFSNIDGAIDDNTQQLQGGLGVSGSLNRNLEFRFGYQHYFTVSGENYQDNALGATLAWHFKKPEAMPVSSPAPQPESVPATKEVVETLELKVLFDFDKSVIKSAFEPQFKKMAEALRTKPDISITIEGHTDSIGTDEYNQGLSERRANAVKQKLVNDYGIAPDRLDIKGYGESRPVADNSTPAGRQKNRRAIAVIMQTRKVTE